VRTTDRAALAPGGRSFVAAIVSAQVLTQIGAFNLPALLPGYIERWSLSKTEAGWLIGIFFAAYVPAVPVLLALTDRVPARRIYLIGTGLTALSHFGFAMLADGFWSGLLMRALAGVGWAGAYMPGLKAIADPFEGPAQSRAVSWHAAGVASPAPCPSPSPVSATLWPGHRRRFSSARPPRPWPS
jgi:MFS family permease